MQRIYAALTTVMRRVMRYVNATTEQQYWPKNQTSR